MIFERHKIVVLYKSNDSTVYVMIHNLNDNYKLNMFSNKYCRDKFAFLNQN